jgi:SAM-dependent methyltransferase
MHPVTCDLCGSKDTLLLLTKRGFRLVKCAVCGLVYVNPAPDPTYLTAMYQAGGYYQALLETLERPEFVRRARQRLQVIQAEYGKKGALLDVGCAVGLFLREAADCGWQVHGIDVSHRMVQHARDSLGVDARAGTLQESDFQPHSFDVVTFFDSLEHMPSPASALKKAGQLLKPGGLLLATMPNIDGLLPRCTYNVLCRPFGIWEHPTPPDHLYEFSVDTITKLVERAGFEVSQVRSQNIALGYTVFELRSTLIEVVNRVLGRGLVTSPWDSSGSRSGSAFLLQEEQGPQFELIRRLIRGTLLIACYGLVLPPHLCSRVIGQGNETMIVAKKGSLPTGTIGERVP